MTGMSVHPSSLQAARRRLPTMMVLFCSAAERPFTALRFGNSELEGAAPRPTAACAFFGEPVSPAPALRVDVRTDYSAPRTQASRYSRSWSSRTPIRRGDICVILTLPAWASLRAVQRDIPRNSHHSRSGMTRSGGFRELEFGGADIVSRQRLCRCCSATFRARITLGRTTLQRKDLRS